jgi:hypothetical protein
MRKINAHKKCAAIFKKKRINELDLTSNDSNSGPTKNKLCMAMQSLFLVGRWFESGEKKIRKKCTLVLKGV